MVGRVAEGWREGAGASLIPHMRLTSPGCPEALARPAPTYRGAPLPDRPANVKEDRVPLMVSVSVSMLSSPKLPARTPPATAPPPALPVRPTPLLAPAPVGRRPSPTDDRTVEGAEEEDMVTELLLAPPSPRITGPGPPTALLPSPPPSGASETCQDPTNIHINTAMHTRVAR